MESMGLSGMKSISCYFNRSEAAVRKWIRDHGFPAAKIGGAWESDSKMVEEWKERRILEAYQKAVNE